MSLGNHNWRDVLKVLTNHLGFRVARQKGDHIMIVHDQTRRYATIPRHSPIKEATLKSVLFQTGIETDEFLKHI
ncbi:MAG: type II toxin-antitoxin system HicA family toxin [Candidatus Nitrosopolaris sp.]